jgi:hypothetical protein
LKTLWDEYRSSASSGNETAIVTSFSQFIDAFREAQAELENEDAVADLVERLFAAEPPSVVGDVSSLMEKVPKVEQKLQSMKLLVLLGSSEERRMELFRRDGFRTMLSIFQGGNEELQRQVLKTIRHFLAVSSSSHALLLDQIVSLRDAQKSTSQDEILASEELAGHGAPKRSHRRTMSDKVTGVVSDVSKMLTSELSRLFPSLSYAENLETLDSAAGNADATSPAAPIHESGDAYGGTVGDSSSSPALSDHSSAVALDQGRDPRSRLSSRASSVVAMDTRRSSADYSESGVLNFPPSLLDIQVEMEDVLRRISASVEFADSQITAPASEIQAFLGMQGALSSLTELVRESALSVQLDLVKTVSRLLFNNRRNQAEMRRIDGYSFFLRLFQTVHDFSSVDAQRFLQDCFEIITVLVLDGRKDGRVGNIDAFEMLLSLASNRSSLPDVSLQALRCLREILALSMWNVLLFRQSDGLTTLLDGLRCDMPADKGTFSTINRISRVRLASLNLTAEILGYCAVVYQRADSLVMTRVMEFVYEGKAWLPLEVVLCLMRLCLSVALDLIARCTRFDMFRPQHIYELLSHFLVLSNDELHDANILGSDAKSPEGSSAHGLDVVLCLIDIVALCVEDDAWLGDFLGPLGGWSLFRQIICSPSTSFPCLQRTLALLCLMSYVCAFKHRSSCLMHSRMLRLHYGEEEPVAGAQPETSRTPTPDAEQQYNLTSALTTFLLSLLKEVKGSHMDISNPDVDISRFSERDRSILVCIRSILVSWNTVGYQSALSCFTEKGGLGMLVDIVSGSTDVNLDALLCIGEVVRGSNVGKQLLGSLLFEADGLASALQDACTAHPLERAHILVIFEIACYASFLDVVTPLPLVEQLSRASVYSRSFVAKVLFASPIKPNRSVHAVSLSAVQIPSAAPSSTYPNGSSAEGSNSVHATVARSSSLSITPPGSSTYVVSSSSRPPRHHVRSASRDSARMHASAGPSQDLQRQSRSQSIAFFDADDVFNQGMRSSRSLAALDMLGVAGWSAQTHRGHGQTAGHHRHGSNLSESAAVAALESATVSSTVSSGDLPAGHGATGHDPSLDAFHPCFGFCMFINDDPLWLLRTRSHGLIFRSSEAAAFVTNAIWHWSMDEATRCDSLLLLNNLLNIHPRNRQILTASSTNLQWLLSKAKSVGSRTRSLCLEAAATLGRYSLTPDELTFLLRDLDDPMSVAEASSPLHSRVSSDADSIQQHSASISSKLEEGASLADVADASARLSDWRTSLLSVLVGMSERNAPARFFSFDGLASGFCAGSIRTMPPSKVGFTVRLAFRIAMVVPDGGNSQSFLPASATQARYAWNDASSVLASFVDSASLCSLEVGLRMPQDLSLQRRGSSRDGSSARASDQYCIAYVRWISREGVVEEQIDIAKYMMAVGPDRWHELSLSFSKSSLTVCCSQSSHKLEYVLPFSMYPKSVTKDKPLHIMLGRRPQLLLSEWNKTFSLLMDEQSMRSFPYFSRTVNLLRTEAFLQHCFHDAGAFFGQIGEFDVIDRSTSSSLLPSDFRSFTSALTSMAAEKSGMNADPFIPLFVRSSHSTWVVMEGSRAADMPTDDQEYPDVWEENVSVPVLAQQLSAKLTTLPSASSSPSQTSIALPPSATGLSGVQGTNASNTNTRDDISEGQLSLHAGGVLTPTRKRIVQQRCAQRVAMLDGATFHATIPLFAALQQCGGLPALYEYLASAATATEVSLLCNCLAALISNDLSLSPVFLNTEGIERTIRAVSRFVDTYDVDLANMIFALASYASQDASACNAWCLVVDSLFLLRKSEMPALDIQRLFLRRLLDAFLESPKHLDSFRRGPSLLSLLLFWTEACPTELYSMTALLVSQVLRSAAVNEVHMFWGAVAVAGRSSPLADVVCSMCRMARDLLTDSQQFAEMSTSYVFLPSCLSLVQLPAVDDAHSTQKLVTGTSCAQSLLVSLQQSFSTDAVTTGGASANGVTTGRDVDMQASVCMQDLSEHADEVSPSLFICFGLLESSIERIRVEGVLTIMALLRSSSRCRALFFRNNSGFERLESLLARSPAGALTFDSLLQCARDSLDITVPASTSVILRQPEALRIVFTLLHLCCTDAALHLKVLGIIERMLEDDANCDVLLEYNWFDKCWRVFLPFIQPSSTRASAFSPDFCDGIERITRRLAWVDLCRNPRSCKLLRIREMADVPDVQLSLLSSTVEAVSDYEEGDDPSKLLATPSRKRKDTTAGSAVSTPASPPKDGMATSQEKLQSVLKNLASLLEHVEQDVPLSPASCLQIVSCINELAYRSSSEVRTRMKAANLFSVRDTLTLHFFFLLEHVLATSASSSSAASVSGELVQKAPFVSVAEQQSFREGGGLLCILRIFIMENALRAGAQLDPTDAPLVVGDALITLFMHIEENRKLIAKIIPDDVVVCMLESSENACDFLYWYFAETQSQRRHAVDAAVLKAWSSVEDTQNKAREKLVQKRTRKLKVRQEEKQKVRLLTAKVLHDLEQRSVQYAGDLRDMCAYCFTKLDDLRLRRCFVHRDFRPSLTLQ